MFTCKCRHTLLLDYLGVIMLCEIAGLVWLLPSLHLSHDFLSLEAFSHCSPLIPFRLLKLCRFALKISFESIDASQLGLADVVGGNAALVLAVFLPKLARHELLTTVLACLEV